MKNFPLWTSRSSYLIRVKKKRKRENQRLRSRVRREGTRRNEHNEPITGESPKGWEEPFRERAIKT